MLSLVTKSPLALSKVAPTRLDCCENGPRRQRRRRGVDSSISNLFAATFQTPSLFSAPISSSSCSLAWAVAEQSKAVVSPRRDLPEAAAQRAAAAALLRSHLSVPGPHARPALHIFLPISFLPPLVICARHRTSVKVRPWGGVKSVDARPIEIQP